MYRTQKPNGCIGHLSSIKLTDICALQIASLLERSADWKAELADIKAKVSTDCYDLIISYLAKTLGLISAILESQSTSNPGITSIVNSTYVIADEIMDSLRVGAYFVKTPVYASCPIRLSHHHTVGTTSDGKCVVFSGFISGHVVYYLRADDFATQHTLVDCHLCRLVNDYLVAVTRHRRTIWQYNGSWKCISDTEMMNIGILTFNYRADWNKTSIAGLCSSGWLDKFIEVNPHYKSDTVHWGLLHRNLYVVSPDQQLITIPHYVDATEKLLQDILICDWDGRIYYVIVGPYCLSIYWPIGHRIVLSEMNACDKPVHKQRVSTAVISGSKIELRHHSVHSLGYYQTPVTDSTGRFIWLRDHPGSAHLCDTETGTSTSLKGISSVTYLYDYWFAVVGHVIVLIHDKTSLLTDDIREQIAKTRSGDVLLLIRVDTQQVHLYDGPFRWNWTSILASSVLVIGDIMFDGEAYLRRLE